MVVRVLGSDDVRLAIAFAREHALPLSVRSGGHGSTGFGTNDGGVVIDLAAMTSVEVIDAEHRIVRVDAGATWAKVAETLAPHQLAISAGDTGNVGVGGLLLGGGIGWLVRKYGLALDSLVAADVVTAEGRLLRASAEEHPDLFWAIRGGGGNFGVVTAVEVVAQPVTNVVFGTISYPATELASVLTGWRDVMATAGEDLTTAVAAIPEMGPQPASLIITICHAAGDLAAAEQAVEPLLGIGTVLSKDLEVRAYADILEDVGGPGAMPEEMSATVRSGLARRLDDELVDALVAGTERLGSLVIEVRSLGGALANVDPAGTAFGHRDSQLLVTTAMMASAPALREATPAFDQVAETIAPHISGAYVNFLSATSDADVASVYPPDTHRRLAAVKATYDPENIFHRNHNIRPLLGE